MDLDELKDMVDEVKERYSYLVDTDVEEAFMLMKEASSLQATVDMVVAHFQKEYADVERYAKVMQAKISSEASPQVSKGDRVALQDERCIEAWTTVAKTMKAVREMEALAKLLGRIYFDCKMVTENGYRRERVPVGDNRIVGRT